EPTNASAEELRALCEEELAGRPDPERKARLHYELGRLCEVELEDASKAAEHYQSALRATPGHAAALRGARRVLAELGRYPALPALYDAEVEITREPAARARLLYAKARLMEEHLRQSGPALEVYREALALDPGSLTILKAIERGLRRDKRWEPLTQTYEQLANAVEDPALRAAWTSVRAQLTETRLKDPVQAEALYEAALEADPHATAALANVKRLGAAQRRWPQLVQALRQEHDLCRDPRTRLTILATIAGIQERRLGDAEAAVATLEEALETAPDERALLADVARLHRASGRHRREAETLARLVEHTPAGAERAVLCHRVAHVQEQQLGDTDRARPWYERALDEDPTHRAAALALARLHEARERWEEAVDVWRRRAEAVSAPKERAELHHRIGRLLERRLGRPEEAIASHERAVALDPEHHEAFLALTRLLAAAERWRALAELYERALDRAANDGEAIAWLFRIGAVYEDRLDDPAGALAAYDRILARDAEHLGALHAAQRAAERAGEHARVVETLKAEAALLSDPERKASLLHRAAVVTADGLDDPAAAIRALDALAKTHPKHRPTLETLAALLSDAGQWEELTRVYTRLIPLTSTASEKVRLHHRVGEIQQLQLGKDERAIQSYRVALQLDPDFEPAREALLEALERTEAWKDLAEALEARLERLDDPVERARAATELGTLQEERLGAPDAALGFYERALEAVPLHRPALDARERLLTEAEDWNRLTEVLEEEAAALEDPFLKTQAALRAALVMAEQQGAVAPALDAFRPVFAERPDHVGALLAVEEIYARTRDDAGLAVTYEKMIEVVSDPKAKLAALQELARAQAATEGDTTAIQRRILQLSPDDPAALEALASEAERADDRHTQLAMHARLASTASDATVGAYHQTRVGEVLLGDGDAGGAMAAFRAALGLDPNSLTAARGLTRAARAARDPSGLREAARHEHEITRDRPVAVGVLLEAAALHLAADRADEAAADYARALELDPENEDAATGLHATLVPLDRVPELIDRLGRAARAAGDAGRGCALHRTVAQLAADRERDFGAAVAAAERALKARPDDPEALADLAGYLERNGQWEEAVQTLDRLVPKARDEALVEAHLRLARIAEAHLDDPDRAMRSLRAVLARDEEREEALAALVRLERAAGRDEEALRLAKKLLSVVDDPDRKAATLAELAELELKRGEHAAAASAAFNAVGLQGPDGPAAGVYQRLITKAGDAASWENYTTALMTYLDRARQRGGEVAGTYRELARIFSVAHNRPDRAIATLREGVESCPDDTGISLALVEALEGVKADDKALAELRRLLRVDPREPRAWRAMASLVRKMGEPDGASVVLAPLVALGVATEEEARTVRGREPRVADAPAGILGRAGLEQLHGENALGESATAFVHALGDVVAKLEGFEPEAWGLTKRDRIRAGEAHPLRVFSDRVAAIFGVPEYDLYLVDGELERAVMVPGGPPALLVPQRLETARDPILAYHLARPLALHSQHLAAVDHLEPRALEHLLVGAARNFEPGFSLGGDEEDLDLEEKRVGKAIGFFSRGRIQDAATTFAATPTADIAAWVADLRTLAARAALLVCDDLLSALEAVDCTLGEDPVADDLACFWVDDAAMRFRRAVAQQL
ncbi:MAG TPA: tetratricopeptide repeat protein, partial [Sandaracinaceae bacterium LLY-WYZ-13_1]|nr:tetratricopeptide repeat protein [Sandaracinaceae bacterium LLY-WYZ-13_1]